MAHPLLDVLLAGGRRADRLTHVREIPARAGVGADWPAWADPSLVAGYRTLGVERPWRHQVAAAEAAWSGRHVALATSTGSGKSLAFWLPALSSVRVDTARGVLDAGRVESAAGRGSVLYLSPTKALAADQLAGLERLLRAADARDLRVATCDGDTSFEERQWVQDHADVVLTNPDMLHYSLLPNHRRWARLLRSLRYVVVDEGHAYRGVFGAHVSLVLRRLARLAEHYRPRRAARRGLTFVVASATTAEPAVSAGRLAGVDPASVLVVSDDASPAGARTFALWEPPELAGYRGAPTSADAGPVDEAPVPTDRPEHPRRTATAEASDLLADLVAHGARTLAFTRSRRGAESVATATREHLRPVDPALVGRVAAYRGGYLPEERRELEQAVRDGTVTGLATTNALELGVDISGLDAVLIAGWPGTRMSVWQQAGRAGRAGADGLVVFVAREDPLDTYLVHHPEAVFDAPLEATVFDPANPYVLAPHLCAAAAELPVRAEELDAFGRAADVRSVLDVLVARGALRRRASGWYWTHAQGAAGLTDLRGSGAAPVRVVEAETGRLLGTVDAAAADGQVHDGAVYVHQGATYVVDHLDLTDGVALATRRAVDHGTWSRDVTSIEVVGLHETAGEESPEAPTERRWGPVTWGVGRVEVRSQVVGFQRRRLPDMQVLGTEPLEMPERALPTVAVWWSVPDGVLEEAGIDAETAPGALHAAEHASIGLLPLLATCDRWDLGGVSTALHEDTGQATVFVYDAYPGGAGFAERGYELGATWLRATRAAIAACPCESGCPACVQSPKCGSLNAPLDKAAAVRLLDAVLAHAPGEPRGR
ncbi:DEAD/DEAH box helicase [Cellulomonas sp. PhB143]|uniref:DEAD/DEAH box helicase n=1 Tax=Cellulomonas sp. PhB143 TaxID=2485186 RepID=UPI001F3D0EF1|nr:DEAD/DEAH box helicase [Cellulomonas sp. PhB143]